MIEVKNLHKEFIQDGNTLKILKGIDVNIKKGERIVLIGPSGSGKSTFLRCLNLLEKPTQGEIKFNGEVITDSRCNIDNIRKKIGMVFQHFNLFPHLTVLQNITLAPINLKILSTEKANQEAIKLLNKVGLGDKGNCYPSSLSGGQKQRVAIVRALIMNPEVMLFDEPTSALDPEMVKEVTSVMVDIASQGMTMMFVTHEMTFVKQIATRILFMDEGKIILDETPERFFKGNQNPRVDKFLSRFS